MIRLLISIFCFSNLFSQVEIAENFELSFFSDKPKSHVIALNHILAGDDSASALSKEVFQNLHQWAVQLISSQKNFTKDELKEALEFVIIASQLASSKEAMQRAALLGVKESDEEDFFREVMNHCPYIFPSFSKLHTKQQGLVKAIANMPSVNRILRLEGREIQFFETLKNVVKIQPSPTLFEIKLLLSACQPNYRDSDHKELWALREICLQMDHLEPSQAFTLFEKKKAQWLGYSLEDPYDRLLTSLGAWLGLSTFQEGKELKKELASLDPIQLEKMIQSHEKMRKEGKTKTEISNILQTISLRPK